MLSHKSVFAKIYDKVYKKADYNKNILILGKVPFLQREPV